MPNGLTDDDWGDLLRRIKNHECTPFVGAGACARTLPLASDLAESWAAKYEYPLADTTNLARVAQYLAVQRDPIFPKQELRDTLRGATAPDFAAPDEPHGVLAALDLPIYLTTNYDGLMLAALQAQPIKQPRRELCGWNDLIRQSEASVFDNGYVPTPASPVVYYLHGHMDLPLSMVLTEDDYLAFLVQLSVDGNIRLLPPAIRTALATTSLLFVGYSLSDWDFRVLFRGLMGSLGGTIGSTSIAVQLDPSPADHPQEQRKRAQEYLSRYFEKIQKITVRVYWGDVRDFSLELRQRWEAFVRDGA
jgi:hypothetical protein